MFTGIVEELGTVVRLEREGGSARLVVEGPLVTSDAVHGASIAVNGVCLTVTDESPSGGRFAVDVMAETLSRSSLGGLVAGDRVNLERAMPADGRFGGHVVQGHVDGVGTVAMREPGDRWERVRVEVPPGLARYLVEKGSVTVDGVSLTVTAVSAPDEAAGLVRGRADPHHARADDAGPRPRGRAGEPGGGRARQVRRADRGLRRRSEAGGGTTMSVRVDPIEHAVAEIAAGRPVLVLDAADREDEGDLVMAAEHVTTAWMAFFVRHGTGYVCAPMEDDRADHLGLPLMVARGEESMGTAFTVTVDARDGVGTGISAADRARTVRLLADGTTTASDLVRPGSRRAAALAPRRGAGAARPHRGGGRPRPARGLRAGRA